MKESVRPNAMRGQALVLSLHDESRRSGSGTDGGGLADRLHLS